MATTGELQTGTRVQTPDGKGTVMCPPFRPYQGATHRVVQIKWDTGGSARISEDLWRRIMFPFEPDWMDEQGNLI